MKMLKWFIGLFSSGRSEKDRAGAPETGPDSDFCLGDEAAFLMPEGFVPVDEVPNRQN